MFNLFAFLGLSQAQSKDSSPSSVAYSHSIQQAIVEEVIHGPYQKGRVYFDCTWWPAVCEREVILLPGQSVRVVRIDNITIIVEPLTPVQNEVGVIATGKASN